MDIRRFEYFKTLAETGSFSETAERLFTTQGNVSKQLKALEQELNIRLIDRSHRQLTLTEAGNVLLPHAAQILADYQAMQAALSGVAQSGLHNVRICSIPVMAHYDITGFLSGFSHENPDISMSIQEMESVNILTELSENRCDFAFMRMEQTVFLDYDTLSICRDRFAVVLSSRHPLAGRDRVSLAELSGETFLQLDKSTLLFDLFLSACREAGFEPHIGYQGTRMENIIELVANQMGISLLMQEAAEYVKIGSITILPLEEKISSEILLLRPRKKRYAPAALRFWRYMEREIMD